MIDKRGYYYSQHYNTSFLNKKKLPLPPDQIQPKNNPSDLIGVLTGTSIQKYNNYLHERKNYIYVKHKYYQNKKSENLTFDKLKQIITSTETEKRSTSKNFKNKEKV